MATLTELIFITKLIIIYLNYMDETRESDERQ